MKIILNFTIKPICVLFIIIDNVFKNIVNKYQLSNSHIIVIIISLILNKLYKGLRFEILVITTPVVFLFKFLEEISLLVISLTAIFKFSISISFFTFLGLVSLNSSEVSSLPRINLLEINFYMNVKLQLSLISLVLAYSKIHVNLLFFF